MNFQLNDILNDINDRLLMPRIGQCNRVSQMAICLLALLLRRGDVLTYQSQEISDVHLIDGIVGISTNLERNHQWIKVTLSDNRGMYNFNIFNFYSSLSY